MLNAIQTQNAVHKLPTGIHGSPEHIKYNTEKNRIHRLFHDYLVDKYARAIPHGLYPAIWSKACFNGYSSYELIESNYQQEAEFVNTIVFVVRAVANEK